MKVTPLAPYPFLEGPMPEGLQVSAGAVLSANQLELKFRIEADNEARFSVIKLPDESSASERKNELWKNTCFECFIAASGSAAYLEFNGSANGDWNWYSFTGYRTGMQEVSLDKNNFPKQWSRKTTSTSVEVEWVLPLEGLTKGFMQVGAGNASIETLGLTVVLNGADTTTYWALKHEGVKPDFHRRESFIYDSFRN